MTTNLFAIANVKQLRTYLILEFYCLFFGTSWGVGVLNSAILFNSFHNWVEFGTIFWRAFGISGGGVLNTPNPPRYATDTNRAFVCNLRCLAHNAHASYCHLWPAPLYFIFPRYLINGTIFEKKLLNTKCVF